MIKKPFLFIGLAAVGIAATFFSINAKCFGKCESKPKSRRPDVTIIGPIDLADGIGRQTAELANSIRDKFKVQIVANHIDRTDLSRPIERILKKKFNQFGKVVIFEESLWHPDTVIERVLETTSAHDQIRIAYSMLESTRIPQEWVMQLNLYYDAVVVPDAFLIEAYRESGVTIPVFEIPLGLDLKNFLDKPLKKKHNTPMVFSNLSSSLDRKNQVLLIQAFAKALGNNPKAVLRINSRIGDDETKQAIVNEILKQNCSNIHFTEIKLKKDAYLKFFQQVDCYVSLSKGEGFSIQPREAMALGIPVIATDNTGQTTICNSGLVKVVKSEIVEPCYYFNSRFNSGYRYNCEIDDAAAAIKDVFLNYDKYLCNGEEARKWASQYSYSSSNLSEFYKALVYPKKVILGDRNEVTTEYLMTDSEELYDKYQSLVADWKKNGTELDKYRARIANKRAK